MSKQTGRYVKRQMHLLSFPLKVASWYYDSTFDIKINRKTWMFKARGRSFFSRVENYMHGIFSVLNR